ncbi:hypothetical protein SAMN04487895_101480 [Paenibacillus sophorae]|uniref:Uncharacterized protein n=2 Tax=Paenibacillus sophorae TaxID=1333845 RepID=A0A1H8GE03_9BACL|nr:hypothetical protein [Paenibacillus sophorae]SEN42223.1 hypothetical protein SAMN04487895_101480 [Paenibacillus sophorae]
MNLVGHNMALVEELKIHMLKRIELYEKRGFIKKGKYKELVEFETKAMDERLETMKQWL